MVLEINDLSLGYSKDKPILEHINLKLTDGDVCCVLGPNGVGKSTVFKTMLNLLEPIRGRISIDGNDTLTWSPKKLSSYMAYVPQAHIPAFPYKVREIAMMGRMGQMKMTGQPSKSDFRIVEQVLEEVGIRHLRDRMYTDISGGERQLLMVARALAQEPKILLMDEPTANLDFGNMVKVLRVIRELSQKGMCIMFTTHMPDQAFMCGGKTVLLMPDGSMKSGKCDEVITEKNLNEAYGTDVQIVKVIGNDGGALKFVAPRFRG